MLWQQNQPELYTATLFHLPERRGDSWVLHFNAPHHTNGDQDVTSQLTTGQLFHFPISYSSQFHSFYFLKNLKHISTSLWAKNQKFLLYGWRNQTTKNDVLFEKPVSRFRQESVRPKRGWKCKSQGDTSSRRFVLLPSVTKMIEGEGTMSLWASSLINQTVGAGTSCLLQNNL